MGHHTLRHRCLFLWLLISSVFLCAQASAHAEASWICPGISEQCVQTLEQRLDRPDSSGAGYFFDTVTMIKQVWQKAENCADKERHALIKLDSLLSSSRLTSISPKDNFAYSRLLLDRENHQKTMSNCLFVKYQVNQQYHRSKSLLSKIPYSSLFKRELPLWQVRTIKSVLNPDVHVNKQFMDQQRLLANGDVEQRFLMQGSLFVVMLFSLLSYVILTWRFRALPDCWRHVLRQLMVVFFPFTCFVGTLHWTFHRTPDLFNVFTFSFTSYANVPIVHVFLDLLWMVLFVFCFINVVTTIIREHVVWRYAMFTYQVLLNLSCFVYIYYLMYIHNLLGAIAFRYYEYAHIYLIFLFVRTLAKSFQEKKNDKLAGSSTWLAFVDTLRQRCFVLLGMIFVYNISDLLNENQIFSPEFVVISHFINIVLLNFVLLRCMMCIVQYNVFQKNLSKKWMGSIRMGLQYAYVLLIVMAILGYQRLAFSFFFNLFFTYALWVIVRDGLRFWSSIYHALSDPHTMYSKQFRRLFNEQSNATLIELYIPLLTATIPLLILCCGCFIQIWSLDHALFLLDHYIYLANRGVSIFSMTFDLNLLLESLNLFCLWCLLGRLITSYVSRRHLGADDMHEKAMFYSLMQYLFFITGVLFVFQYNQMNLKSIVLITSALSIGIGFGLRHFVSNFISGLFVFFNKPIKIGDHVIVDKNEGVVKKINLFSTQMETASCTELIIPNSMFFSTSILNFTFDNNKLYRINIQIIPQDNENYQLEETLLLEVAAKNKNIKQSSPYAPMVLFKGTYLELSCVVLNVGLKNQIESDLNHDLGEAFKSHNLTITWKEPSPNRMFIKYNDEGEP